MRIVKELEKTRLTIDTVCFLQREEGNIFMGDRERNLTEWEERVIRLIHHEFKAMTQAEAAIELGVSEATISRTVQEMVKKAETCEPIRVLLPILTRLQFEAFTCIVRQGLSAVHTAASLGLTESVVNKMMTTMRNKGMKIPKRCNMPKTKSYAAHLDNEVKHKF